MPLHFRKNIKTRKNKKPLKGLCTAVIAAAGASTRMEGVDKQFAEICGKPVLAHTLDAFQRCKDVDEIIVAARPDDLTCVGELCAKYGITKAVSVIAGGEERLDSVLNGVRAVSKKTALIAIHDGARPCVTENVISQTIAAARKYHAAAPAIPVVPTLKRAENGVITETVDRTGLFEVQTPQVFDADVVTVALINAKNKKLTVTDDCMAVEALGMQIHITEGICENIKITTSGDLIAAEAFINAKTAGE